MANLTITVADETLRKARLRALGQATSVNALLRQHLESYAAGGTVWDEAVDSILELSRRAESGRGDRRWNRDELHER